MRSFDIKNVGLLLGNSKPTLGQCLVFAGLLHIYFKKIKLQAMPSFSEILDG